MVQSVRFRLGLAWLASLHCFCIIRYLLISTFPRSCRLGLIFSLLFLHRFSLILVERCGCAHRVSSRPRVASAEIVQVAQRDAVPAIRTLRGSPGTGPGVAPLRGLPRNFCRVCHGHCTHEKNSAMIVAFAIINFQFSIFKFQFSIRNSFFFFFFFNPSFVFDSGPGCFTRLARSHGTILFPLMSRYLPSLHFFHR